MYIYLLKCIILCYAFKLNYCKNIDGFRCSYQNITNDWLKIVTN